MYITTQQLAKKLIEDSGSADEVLTILYVIRKLVATYGKLAFRPQIVQSVARIDTHIARCMGILYTTGKRTTNDIKNIIAIIKSESKHYTQQFTIRTPAGATHSIQSAITKKFEHSDIYTKNSDTIDVSIAGEGRYYQRSLDQDLKKLLKV